MTVRERAKQRIAPHQLPKRASSLQTRLGAFSRDPSLTSCGGMIGDRLILLYYAARSLGNRPPNRSDRRAVNDHVMSWQVTVNVVI